MAGKFVLIVEDNREMADSFKEILEMYDHEIECVYDGRDAENRLREIVPDFVILDINLPYVDGDVLLDQIRADSRLGNTRVVIASANSVRANALKDIADVILIKPIGYDKIDELLEWTNSW